MTLSLIPPRRDAEPGSTVRVAVRSFVQLWRRNPALGVLFTLPILIFFSYHGALGNRFGLPS